MRVLVTGAEGFVGQYLLPALRAEGHSVLGTTREATVRSGLRRLDVTDAYACSALLAEVAPAGVVHLAAVSSVRWSYTHPSETYRVNVEGTRNLLAAAASLSSPPRVLVVGSAEVYGPNDGHPLRELPVEDLRPLSPYAESKVAVERLILVQPRLRAIAIRTRSFPHWGPRQPVGFFASDVASVLARIARGEHPPVLRVGSVDVVRDILDVRDVVRAYVLLLTRGVPGAVYNVCSGRGVSLRRILERLTALGRTAVHVEPDPARRRPSEIPVLIGDPAACKAATGWVPAISLEQTLTDVLAYWRTATAPAVPALAAAEKRGT